MKNIPNLLTQEAETDITITMLHKVWPEVHIQRYDLIVMFSDEAQYHILEDVSYGILKTRLKLEWHFLQMFSFNSSLPTTDLFCFRKKGVL